MKRVSGFILGCLLALPLLAEEQAVYVYNWSEYLPDAVIEQFEAETGIKVYYTTYDSNEALYAKLKMVEKSEGYDIAVPSTYFVNKMRLEGMLLPIDKSKLASYANLDPKLLDKPHDPDNAYSVPYLWGTTGIAVDGNRVDPAKVTSWGDLWRPEFKGKILLTNDLREVFDIGLRTLGYSGNTTDPKQLEAAYDKLTSLIPNVRVFNSESPKDPFLTGEVVIGIIYSGEAYMARQENPKITYIYPKEGPIIWVDSMVIPKSARNVENAYKFIDFILKPEIARTISEEVGYATPNLAAFKTLDPEIRDDRTIYPTEEDLAKGEYQLDVGAAIQLYEQYWERLKISE